MNRGLLREDAGLAEPFRLRALAFRDALYRIFSCLAAGGQPESEDIETLNGELREALQRVQFDQRLQWGLDEPRQKKRALMLIALSAAELVSSPLRERIRECPASECGWIFIDQSKNRSRRWCSMSDCGNLEKARRHLEKKRMEKLTE